MKKLRKWLHDKLGWGYPDGLYYEDKFQPTYHCEFCDLSLAQDSTGAYFHLTNNQ